MCRSLPGQTATRPSSWTDRAETLVRSSLECMLTKRYRMSATLGGGLRGERCACDIDRLRDQSDLLEQVSEFLLGGDDLLRDRFDTERASVLGPEEGVHIETSFTGHQLSDLLGMVSRPLLGFGEGLLENPERLNTLRSKCA